VITLRKVSVTDGDKEQAFLLSFPLEENGFSRPGKGFDIENPSGFQDYIKRRIEFENGINIPEDRVPETMFWILYDGQLAGIGKARHYLNDQLRIKGGHIGIGIHSDFRGKSVGTEAMRLLIEYVKSLGQDKVLITNRADNIGSRRITEKNGGILEKIENGRSYYWA